MTKLWKTKNSKGLDPIVEAFETGGDLLLDQKLILCDVYGGIAHAMGLAKIGILSSREIREIREGLMEIVRLAKSGQFQLQFGDEDMHTKIENFLTDKYGAVGKKIHTGRSRNDQVLTAMRLYIKEELLDIYGYLLSLINELIVLAGKYEFVPMPGYTHMQQAMPSSLGLWFGAFSEQLLDDLEILKSVYKLNNQSPLGSAAAYGVPLNLDRDYTSALLGFTKVQKNSLYCQNSRLHIEAYILSAVLGLLQTVNKLGSDVLLFSTKEFGFFDISEKVCTGSSIMPQKKNVDVAELIRSKFHIVLANFVAIASMSANLISGYNRDFQDGKKPVMESLDIASETLKVAKILVENIKPNVEKMANAMDPEIFATHKALSEALNGKSFRDAYKNTKMKNGKCNNGKISFANLQKLLLQSTHIGGTGNLKIKNQISKIKNEKKHFSIEKNKHYQTISKLLRVSPIVK